MLGREVTRVLQNWNLDVVPTTRDKNPKGSYVHFGFDSNADELRKFFSNLGEIDYVINCIGMIKQKYKPDSEIVDSILLNTLLPSFLEVSAGEFGFRVIQIATDCVFSGKVGNYSELSLHDAKDLYGVTKSLGEISSDRFLNLRCSIIGEESITNFSLYSWLLSQPRNAVVNGFSDHYWNGITTESFGRIVAGILTTDSFIPGIKHVVPADSLTKLELLELISRYNGRQDIVINSHETGTRVDRTLATEDEKFNAELWRSAGYENKPTIEHMIQEYAAQVKRSSN
jgi:dTDP-4-dehydrorhamnose reductase